MLDKGCATVAERLLNDTIQFKEKAESLEKSFKASCEPAALQVEKLCKQLWDMRSGLRDTIKFMADQVCQLLPEGCTRPERKSKTYDWVTAINLTTDFTVGDKPAGVVQRMKELTDFASKTKDKPVAFIVQAAFPENAEKSSAEGSPADKEQAKTERKFRLERYLICNGSITKLETLPSEGYAKDLESLVRFTTKNYHSKKLGLIVDSHGQGNEGLSGDTGKVSLDQFKRAVSEGLKGNGKSKLDILTFDCCLIAQDGAIKMSSSIAKEIVASTTKIQTEGQNLVGTLEKLSDNPAIDESKLADTYINTARSADSSGWASVRTLAHFKAEKFPSFEKQLDECGDALGKVLDLPGGRAALGKVIDDTRRYNNWGDNANEWDTGNTADLKDFLRRVGEAIRKGEIPDKDGSLRKAVDGAVAKQDDLVVSYFGSPHMNDFHKCGGLSTYLPKGSIRDIDTGARRRNEAGLLARQSEKAIRRGYKTEEERLELVKDIACQLADTEKDASGDMEATKQIAAIKQAYANLEKSRTPDDFKKASTALSTQCEALERTSFYATKAEQARKQLQKETGELYSTQRVTDKNGWGRFQLKLRDPKSEKP